MNMPQIMPLHTIRRKTRETVSCQCKYTNLICEIFIYAERKNSTRQETQLQATAMQSPTFSPPFLRESNSSAYYLPHWWREKLPSHFLRKLLATDLPENTYHKGFHKSRLPHPLKYRYQDNILIYLPVMLRSFTSTREVVKQELLFLLYSASACRNLAPDFTGPSDNIRI